MKKTRAIRLLRMVFVAILASISFSTCSGSDEDDNIEEKLQWYESMLRGYWCHERITDTSAYYQRYELYEDHTAIRYIRSARRTIITDASGYISLTPWDDYYEQKRTGTWEVILDTPSLPKLLFRLGNATYPISLFGFDGNPELKVDDHLYYRYYSYNDYQRPSF